MKRTIELKHVGPKAHVRRLLEELIDRLEERLGHFDPEAVFLHVVFEENGSHKLHRVSLSCHIPRQMVAAHEEHRDAGLAIRKAFKDMERQLEKRKAFIRHEPQRRRARHARVALGLALGVSVVFTTSALRAEEPSRTSPSPQAMDALRLIESKDAYQRQLGFLRLEALRELTAVDAIEPYASHRDPELRAQGLRALAAIQGPIAVPRLLKALKTDKHFRVRLAALLGLEPHQHTDPEILPALLRALRDRRTEVRMAAVDIVSRIDDPRAREAIQARMKRERRRDVRRVLKPAVERLQEGP